MLISSIASASKLVVAHFIVGNTFNYGVSDWSRDISIALSSGFDAFALNVGSDYWQPQSVAYAFKAAEDTPFKLFLSFDMTSLPCTYPADATILQNYISSYSSHPNQLIYHDATFVSTFAGDYCDFGTGSVNAGWTNAVKNPNLPPVYFVPAFFEPSNFDNLPVMDGAFNWNSGWPMGDYDINTDSDDTYTSNLNGKTYMAAVSPWFFTHYPPASYNKNFIYRADDWLLSARWSLLIENRDSVDIAQLISWNDYGESHYIGPIDGDQPGSQAWVDGFDHQGWLDLNAYHAHAFKTGFYPPIDRDRVFLWARLYPAAATAPDDPVGIPTNWQWTEDYLWAIVLLAESATVTLSCGPNNQTFSLSSGLSGLKLPFPTTTGCGVRAMIAREEVVLDWEPAGFDFSTEVTAGYNFNAFVAASPA